MARTVRDAKLDSRSARDRLKPRIAPYFKTLVPGQLHLGYVRRGRGRGAQGTWVVRGYVGLDADKIGRYRTKTIGLADDFMDADGRKVFNFAQAQARALEWQPNAPDGEPKKTKGPFTVRDAVERYLTAQDHAGKPTHDARQRADLHILPSLGSQLVDQLTTERLRRWLADSAKLPPRIRQKNGVTAPRYKVEEDNPETERRRRSTANRVLTILKAALNHAFDEGHVKSNDAWGRRLKPFRAVDAARTRFLTVAEAKRLINAAAPEFRRLVQAALYTGCRYGELCRLRVADFSGDTGTLAVWVSKTGKARHVFLSDEAVEFFRTITAGRGGNDTMLCKRDGSAWRKSEQARCMARLVERAKISPVISFHGLRHSYASLAVMNNVPLHVVARNLGHVDDRMVQRHYGHMTDSYQKEAIRKGVAGFGFKASGKVVPL